MRVSILALLVVAVLFGAVPVSADEPFVVVVRFYPTPGREDELQARLLKLRVFVQQHNEGVTYRLHRSQKEPVVFLLYETFPSRESFERQVKTIFPAFQRDNGPVPDGIVSRAPEQELYRTLGD